MPRSWTHTGFAQRIVFGPGALRQLPDLLKAVGARRVLLVTTQGRADSPEGDRVRSTLGRTLASTFTGVQSHVPTPSVQAAVRQARGDGVDAVVSFGGGSCADLGKAVCFFTEMEAGTPGASFADRPALPHVAIPTTYSGAEVTGAFGMTDPGTRQKQGSGSPTITPLGVVYDPELTRTTPPRVSAETGMNALAHCVEALWSTRRSPEAEAVALAGAQRLVAALPAVVEEPDDLDLRSAALEGAALAGRCLHNAAMGVHHGLAQLVGGRTGIAHGLANAILLPHTMRFNAEVAPDAIARLGAAMATDEPIDAIASLVAELGLPTGLSDCGVDDEDIEAVARMAPASHAVAANPRPVTEDDARRILEDAF